MRIAGLIFVGSIAALAATTVPALAKNSNSPAMPMPRRSRTSRLRQAATPISRRPMDPGPRFHARKPALHRKRRRSTGP
jgi:hypothetical protein